MKYDVDLSFRTDDEMTRQAVNFVQFMNGRGYVIYPDFYEKFFAVMAATGLAFEDAEPAIKTLVARNREEEASFLFDFVDYIQNNTGTSSRKISLEHEKKAGKLSEKEDAIAETEKKIDRAAKKIESLENRLDFNNADEKDIKYMSGKKMKSPDEVEQICNNLGIGDLEGQLCSGEYNPAEMKEQLRKAIEQSVFSENFKDLMDYFKRAYKVADTYEKSEGSMVKDQISKQQANVERLQQEADELKKQRDSLKKKLSSVNDRMLQKLEAASHREMFQPGGATQAVYSHRDEDVELNTEFQYLSPKQKENIKEYIRENARKFRTRLSRNVHSSTKRKIDMPETCKKACGTNGIPLRLCFEKPVRSKAKLLMFLDISGSCREASELMLYFMYSMKDIFPAGCKCYVFVNHLFDISEFFDTNDPDEAVRTVMSHIQTRGVYSDYGVPFTEFYEEHQAEVTRDSIVFFIGDARNNKYDAGERFIRYIGRKCRSAYWFNTEDKSKWDTGDSIIRTYKPYMDSVTEVTTANELIDSLMMVK